jgi:putative ABC transport system permease protein
LLLAWRQTLRDFRAGELRLLAVAVMLAVAALTAVGFFADRLNSGLQRDARQLLGGDAVVGSDKPAPPNWWRRRRRTGPEAWPPALGFPSMGRAPDDKGGATRLVAVKAVSPAYPLRGKLQLRRRPTARCEWWPRAPQPGTVWVDAALLDALQLQVGDPLLLGDASASHRPHHRHRARPRRRLHSSFAPRVMLAEADLPATGLVQPASRVSYRLAVAAPDGLSAAKADAAVRELHVQWAEQHQERAAARRARRILQSGRPEMRQTLDRAEKFLNLVALLAALLAAVAVGIAARDFAVAPPGRLRHAARAGPVAAAHRRRLHAGVRLVGLLASAAGVLLGLLVHNVFVWLLAGLVDAALPPPGPWPACSGWAWA